MSAHVVEQAADDVISADGRPVERRVLVELIHSMNIGAKLQEQISGITAVKYNQ